LSTAFDGCGPHMSVIWIGEVQSGTDLFPTLDLCVLKSSVHLLQPPINTSDINVRADLGDRPFRFVKNPL